MIAIRQRATTARIARLPAGGRGAYTLFAAAALMLLSSPARAVTNTLRVLAVTPRCFPYKFMSYMSTAGGPERLVFNDLDGATHIVSQGDTLGDYTVTAFEPSLSRVFNPALQADQLRKSGTATLRGKDGAAVALTLGELKIVDGWMACLVDLDTGFWRYVLPGMLVTLPPGKAVRVTGIAEDRVTLHDGAAAMVPLWLEEQEHEALTHLWLERERRRQEALAALRREPEPDPLQVAVPLPPVRPAPPPPPRREVVIRSGPPRFAFGTDVPFPTAFEVVRVPVRTASGQMTYRTLTVPVRFERRATGFGSTFYRTGR